jgi:hypothetical protein
MKTIKSSLLFLFLMLVAGTVAADTGLKLDITGKITHFTDKKASVYHFTEKDLLGLKPYTIKTSTTWTPVSAFTGPKLSDVLDKVGATGTILEMHALDDYTYSIPVSDAKQYGVVLAYSVNGERIKTDRFGPIFVIYPRDDYEELRKPTAEAKFVWQLSRIVVK